MTRLASGRLAALLLLAGLAAPASRAQCAGQHSRQVCRQLDQARAALAREGYAPTHGYTVAPLADDAETQFALPLEAGRAYVVVGACDRDCRALDVWLYDERGHLVGAAASADGAPTVRAAPEWAGTFTVRVRMAECRSEPCYYGIAVFGD